MGKSINDRLRVCVRGLVQGVGFRPFVHRLATELGLTGFVLNDGTGVTIEVEGQATQNFLHRLSQNPPPLSQLESVSVQTCPRRWTETRFEIVDSHAGRAVTTRIGPDIAPCHDCLAEACNPCDRRYLYPFSSCTNCGPRLTVATGLPYDRPQTTLADFPLCVPCHAEYHNPNDRRFHAQPIACPSCGPRLSETLHRVVATLADGGIVALKGVGGYHLLCDATRKEPVHTLRNRKRREGKPLAVLALNVSSARLFAEVTDAEAVLLEDLRRPIVLARRKTATALAPNVAQSLSTMGILLPPSLLHFLLFFEWLGRPNTPEWFSHTAAVALVATSGNFHDEPLICDDDEARDRLSHVADLVVSHNRPIAARCDDSVVREIAGQTVFLRRARGFVPEPIALPVQTPPILGLGGELKTTFCLCRGREAFVSQHIGDLATPQTLRAYREALSHMCHLLGVKPTLAISDAHPDFSARAVAQDLGLPISEVQHHAAHFWAVLAESGTTPPAVGLVLDGFGLGDDGTAWGGELLFTDGKTTRRIGHLAPICQPGGELCARQPWRLATAVLASLGETKAAHQRFSDRWPVQKIVPLLGHTAFSPTTTACGRYFQAAAAILGLKETETYEAEAAMALESQARWASTLSDGFVIRNDVESDGQQDVSVLDFSPLWRALLSCDVQQGARWFHGTMAAGLAALAEKWLERFSLSHVVLSGGCIQNKVLTEALCAEFAARKIQVLLPKRVPPNDAGLCLGQVYFFASALPHKGS